MGTLSLFLIGHFISSVQNIEAIGVLQTFRSSGAKE